MKLIKRVLLGWGIVASLNLAHAQTDTSSISTQAALAAIESTTPYPASAAPRFGNFYSAQFGEKYPPMPFDFMNLPFWPLGDGFYIYDDRDVDYAALRAQAEADAEAAGPRNHFSMMASSLVSSYTYGNPVYLTNMVATNNGTVSTASFSIAGGTNFVPYDILTTTNVANSISNWTWLSIGYTSNSYTFLNQPLAQAFYILAKPRYRWLLQWGRGVSQPPPFTNAVAVAGGENFGLALKADGTVAAWGDNSHGQTNVPLVLTNATVVVAGYDHGMAIRADGTLTNWGSWYFSGTYHAITNPPNMTNIVAISAGLDHDLAAKADGTVVVWGYTNEIYNTLPSGLTGVKDVEAGWNHNVALLTNGTVFAWGMNYGLFGWNLTNVPTGLSNVVSICCGAYHTLALRADGTVVAWGAGNSTNGTQFADQEQSIVPLGLSNVVSIAAGGYHSMALKSDGTVVMWGDMSLPGFTLNQVLGIGSGVQAPMALRGGPLNPPVIVSQAPLPTNQIGIFESNLTFSVSATSDSETNGFPLTYQWQFNGTNIPGATTTNYSFTVQTNTVGAYSVVVSNIAGAAVAGWQTTLTYTGSYIDTNTLAYYLSTNAVAYATGYTGSGTDETRFNNWHYANYTATNLYLLTNAVWSTNFWLHGVKGLSATSLGYSNGVGGQTPITMVSPRHYLFASHTHPEGSLVAFLDTNNVIYWRTTLQRIDIPESFSHGITNDVSVGILNQDLPSSVEFLPIVPTNVLDYLPTNSISYVQGIGMNQFQRIFGQPMEFGSPVYITWGPDQSVPFGLGTNWNATIVGGDSSNPEMLLVSNQLVLASHNFTSGTGPDYAFVIDAINQEMHYLSTNNAVATDYQLTSFSLTNWPNIH